MHSTLLKLPRPFWTALLITSLLLNAVLGYNMLMQRQQPTLAKALPVSVKHTARVFPAPAPFHWSQLDAPDFPTFAKNLRAIGCPEATIRDILSGELDEVYRQKEAQATTQTGQRNGKMNAAERVQPPSERDQILAQLTQSVPPLKTSASPALSQTASSGAATVSRLPQNDSAPATATAASTTPVIPTAFAYGAKSGAGATSMLGGRAMLTAAAEQSQLPPSTAASLQQMQSDFASALGNTTQNPASAEYQTAWQEATRRSDERFSSLFGGDVFVRTQMDAARATSAGAGSAKASH